MTRLCPGRCGQQIEDGIVCCDPCWARIPTNVAARAWLAEHECYPRNELHPGCVTCGRPMSIEEAHSAWFKRRREAEKERTMTGPGATAVPAQARLAEIEARQASRSWPNMPMPVEFADIEWLLAELRATEGDLGVAVQVAAERADEIERAVKMARDAARAEARQYWQRKAVLDLCDQADDDTKPLIEAPCYGYVDTRRIRSALGVGAATGTKGDPDE